MAQAPDNRRRILFIDDDPALLETVGRLFAVWSKNTWHIHLATTSAKAISLLQQNLIDLAVIDVQMPVVDGVQFLQLLQRKHPRVIKVVMTGLATDERRTSALRAGAELFLEKPRSAEGFESVFAALNELVSHQPTDGFRGVLRSAGLPEVIQLECLGRKSSVLEISTGGTRGRVFIENGVIIHCEVGQIAGEAAFNHLLGLNGGEFHLSPFSEPLVRSIEGQWEFLLMEAARVSDEIAQQPPLADDGAPDPTEAAVAAAAVPPGEASPLAQSRIDEILICSREGEVLYEWHCSGLDGRIKLLGQIATRAQQWGRSFPLGQFDRLEILGPQGRIVTQVHPDKKVFVRSTPLRQP